MNWRTLDGEPPPDTPACGFSNELCPHTQNGRCHSPCTLTLCDNRCYSSYFPCVGVRLVYWSLRCTATCVIVSIGYRCCPFLSTFLPRLPFSTQSSHLSSGLPRFLQPPCFFVSDRFGNVWYVMLTMFPAHFTRL